jgi:uncharacterized protein (TIGR03437 family)
VRFLLVGLLFLRCAAAQAILVQNAANPLSQTLVVPGSLITVAFDLRATGLPVLDPKTTTVQIGGFSAPVIGSNNPFSVIALAPRDVPLGQADVTMSYNGQTSQPVHIMVVETNFGLFTQAGGYGPALAENVTTTDVETNNLTHPARPLQFVAVWGTGLGDATSDQVQVLLGGHPMPVVYAGPAPGLDGVDQINFQMANDAAVPDGCLVALEIRVRGAAGNRSSISNSSGAGACSSPFDLTADQMAQLDSGGTIPFVGFDTYSLAAPPPDPTVTGFTLSESFDALSLGLNRANLALMTQPLLADDAFYSCTSTINALLGSVINSSGGIDLGPVLTLTGPGKSLSLNLQGPSGFISGTSLPMSPVVSSPDQLPPSYFVPGVWQVSIPGSQSVPAFQAQITIPPAIRATNFSSLQTIDRQKDLAIQWNSAGYTDADYVSVTVSAAARSIRCNVHAKDGQATVPSALLQQLAPADPSPTTGFQIFLTRRPDQVVKVDVPLTGGGTVPGRFGYSFAESFPVRIQ